MQSTVQCKNIPTPEIAPLSRIEILDVSILQTCDAKTSYTEILIKPSVGSRKKRVGSYTLVWLIKKDKTFILVILTIVFESRFYLWVLKKDWLKLFNKLSVAGRYSLRIEMVEMVLWSIASG